MRRATIAVSVLGMLAGLSCAHADSADPARSPSSARQAIEGRAAQQNEAPPSAGAIDDTGHSVEGANPNRADDPPARESKGP